MEYLTKSDLEEITKSLETLSRRIANTQKAPREQWLDNQEFMQLLKISRRTAQNYRDSNMIAHSIIGNKIYYKLSDIEDLLNRHYRKRLI